MLRNDYRPELIHPFASVIDSPLETPKRMVRMRCSVSLIQSYLISPSFATQVCLKLDSKPAHVRLPEGDKEVFDDYPALSLEEWHKKNGVWVD